MQTIVDGNERDAILEVSLFGSQVLCKNSTECEADVLGQLDSSIEPPQQAFASGLVGILGVDADQRQAGRRDVNMRCPRQEARGGAGTQDRVAGQEYVPGDAEERACYFRDGSLCDKDYFRTARRRKTETERKGERGARASSLSPAFFFFHEPINKAAWRGEISLARERNKAAVLNDRA